MLLSLPGFRGSRDGVLGSPPSSSVPRGPRVGFHSTQHHERHAQPWSKPFLEGQCDNVKVASKVLPKTVSRATFTQAAPATFFIQICRTHSQLPLSPSPSSLLSASKEPTRILRRISTLPPLSPVRTHQNNLSSPREYALLFNYVVLYSRPNFPILDKTQGCAFYGSKGKKIH